MATQQDIPLAYHPENPEQLKRELERLASTLRPYLSVLTGRQNTTVVQKRFVNRPINNDVAVFGEVSRFSLVDDQVVKLKLPAPDPANAGLLIGIRRATADGNVYMSSPGATINGLSIARLTSAPSFVLVEFDGENYYTTPGGTAAGFSMGGV
jgi:hypothetical protein